MTINKKGVCLMDEFKKAYEIPEIQYNAFDFCDIISLSFGATVDDGTDVEVEGDTVKFF